MLIYLIISVLLIAAELAYFRIAGKFHIIDKPNSRSSHTKVILRGGGIIFAAGAVLWSIMMILVPAVPCLSQVATIPLTRYLPFAVSLVLVAGISFVETSTHCLIHYGSSCNS